MIHLDTHVLLWVDSGDRRLGRKSRALIDRYWADGRVAVSAIVFWEAGQLAERGRAQLAKPVREWRDAFLAAGLNEISLNGTAALRSLELAGLQNDPADRFIAATALLNHATLLTADERLLAWRHPLERHDARA